MKNFKLRILLILFLLIFLVASISNGSYSDVTMSVVKEPVCTINFGTKSFVERSVISKDLDNKEITIQLKATNNEENLKPTGELMFVIDNSGSMLDNVLPNKTRKDLIIDSAKNLVTTLLNNNNNLEIGIVTFSSNSNVAKEGTIEDAALVSNLTNDAQSLISSISSIPASLGRTNLDAGLTLAKKYFTEKTDKAHKYIIVLSDGVPNIAINYDKVYFSNDVINKTKASLVSSSSVVDNVIVLLTGISDGSTVVSPSNKTYSQIINEIFGTPEQPTIGKFYYITDDKIENTIKSDIYKDLLPVSKPFTNLNIVDTFTKEIVENFDFSYVKDPNIGTISKEIDKSTNSITWTIPELKPGETAIVQYKLKLKENYSKDILEKVLDTNSKLDLNYTDYSNKTDTKSSSVTPQLKLTEPKVENKIENKVEEDLPKVLPKAGESTLFRSIILVAVIGSVFGIRYILLKNNMD